jgi:lysyl-tRNA synthetase, class II
VAGRVTFLRNTGKLCFATLQEGGASGTQLQAMLSLDKVGAEALAAWKTDVDLGDHVASTGEVITSKRGELSVLADEWRIASKALRPLPVTYKELFEETRVRQRYVDLIVRPRAGQTVRTRSATVRSLHESLQRRGYIEVETPVLQTLRWRDCTAVRDSLERARHRSVPAHLARALPQAGRGRRYRSGLRAESGLP